MKKSFPAQVAFSVFGCVNVRSLHPQNLFSPEPSFERTFPDLQVSYFPLYSLFCVWDCFTSRVFFFIMFCCNMGQWVSFCISLSPDKPINLENYCVPRQWWDEQREAALPCQMPLTFILSKLSWNPPLNDLFVSDRKLSKFFCFSFSIGHLCSLGAFLKLSQEMKIYFYFDTVFSCSSILFSEMRRIVGKEFQA